MRPLCERARYAGYAMPFRGRWANSAPTMRPLCTDYVFKQFRGECDNYVSAHNVPTVRPLRVFKPFWGEIDGCTMRPLCGHFGFNLNLAFWV